MGYTKGDYIMNDIATNIPAPVKNEWRGPMNQLEIGGSFPFDKRFRASVATEASVYFLKKTLKRFTVKNDPENPVTMCRVWRIEDAIPEEN